ncbi:hypothetical protein [Scytonema sp. NUACC26]
MIPTNLEKLIVGDRELVASALSISKLIKSLMYELDDVHVRD